MQLNNSLDDILNSSLIGRELVSEVIERFAFGHYVRTEDGLLRFQVRNLKVTTEAATASNDLRILKVEYVR